MSRKIANAYAPPENFREVDKLPPVVEDATDTKTELWLIRIPANEIGPVDLRERSLKLDVEAADEQLMGQFSNGKGQDYNILKYSGPEMIQPFAIIPNSEKPYVVRKIKHHVAFVKAPNVAANHPKHEDSPRRDRGAAANEINSPNDRQRSQSAMEDPSAKKRRKSETPRKH